MYKFLEIQYKLGKITIEQFVALTAKLTNAMVERDEIVKAQEEEVDNDGNFG